MIMLESNNVVATSALTVLLGGTGVCMFAWMAADHWTDTTGVIIGVIFIVLSIFQILFSLRWYRAVKGIRQEYDLAGKEMAELREKTGPPAMVEPVKGPRESAAPLLKNRESARESADVADVEAKVIEAESQG